MKIKSKISYNCLKAICDLYDVVSEVHASNPQDFHYAKDYKAQINIVNKLFEKLKIKLVKKESTSKPSSMQFQYYEAYYLVTFLRANVEFFTEQYYKAIIYLFTTELDQKL